MKKIDLPLRELLEFPTLLELQTPHESSEFDQIGICHKNGEELSIARDGDEWELLKSIKTMLEEVNRQYGKATVSRDRNIIVYYSLNPPDVICSPGNHVFTVNYVDISKHREMIVFPIAPKLFN